MNAKHNAREKKRFHGNLLLFTSFTESGNSIHTVYHVSEVVFRKCNERKIIINLQDNIGIVSHDENPIFYCTISKESGKSSRKYQRDEWQMLINNKISSFLQIQSLSFRSAFSLHKHPNWIDIYSSVDDSISELLMIFIALCCLICIFCDAKKRENLFERRISLPIKNQKY